MDGVRIQKVLAQAGIGSRRHCDELVSKGKVKVNGQVAVEGQRVSDSDIIEVDNKVIPTNSEYEYFLLNKPLGYVCSLKDKHNKKWVVDLISTNEHRIFPVGRLDKNTSGLLILTNDGYLTNQLTHPSKGVWKKYLVVVNKTMANNDLNKLKNGIQLEDGITAKAKVKQLGKDSFYLQIHEGRNRQIRRMCKALGYEVVELSRVAIGSLQDKTLELGEYRELTKEEVLRLYEE